MSDTAVRIKGLARRFGDVIAVDSVDLEVRAGEMLTVLGPSGCGKTTVLRLVAGLDTPDGGTIDIGGRRVAGGGAMVPPERRRVGMVFQDVALFPHLSVRDNIGYGLRGDPDREVRINELLELIDLPDAARRMPHQLSGGMQQRVAVARALAPRPDVVLLDEPFSSLDAALRTQLRGDVREILRAAGTAAVFVTHDQDEALTLGDRMAVMVRGRIEQIDVPEVVYGEPATPFVATFVGTTNLVHGDAAEGQCASSGRGVARTAVAASSCCVPSISRSARRPTDRPAARPGGSCGDASAAPRSCTRSQPLTGSGCGSRPATRCADCGWGTRWMCGCDPSRRCSSARRMGTPPRACRSRRGGHASSARATRSSPTRSIVSRSKGSRNTTMTSPMPMSR
jgi:iron(III) transport system ATP-binding protein